ncbi:MAG: cytochrome c biogenesis protein CcsA [Hellea sp.]|nr:cytochrome c biogenesis protein CcsA [Hellea sp.]
MFSYLANPQRFLKFARIASPVFLALFLITLTLGLWQALIASPADVKHKEAVRIMYVHVPAAYMAMLCYLALTIASFISYVWRHNLADYGARAFARIGLVFTGLCLITGSIWGRTAWLTWWQWDGRMTSVLVLFFIYIAYLLIWSMSEDKKKAARYAALFAFVGLINIPIIKYSVDWWHSLHQGATFSDFDGEGLSTGHLIPFLLMCANYTFLFFWLSIEQVKTDIKSAQKNRSFKKDQSNIKIEAY